MTESDLLSAIETALTSSEDPEGVMTMLELCEAAGASDKSVRPRLVALKKAGRLETVRVRRENLAGYLTTVPAYRLKP